MGKWGRPDWDGLNFIMLKCSSMKCEVGQTRTARAIQPQWSLKSQAKGCHVQNKMWPHLLDSGPLDRSFLRGRADEAFQRNT